MTKLNGWKMGPAVILRIGAIFALCAVTEVVSSAQTFKTLVDFNSSDGAKPLTVTQGIDGSLYGITIQGGTSNSGTVFKIARSGKLTTLHSFCPLNNCSDGTWPSEGLVLASDGNFYGTTSQGGSGNGTVFKITPGGTLTTLHSFSGFPSDGAQPLGRLVQASDGNLYGTTLSGGASDKCFEGFQGCGTVFKITTRGTLTILHSFDQTDGSNPIGVLLQGTDGSLYGTSGGGGNSCSCGTVFKVSLTGRLTTLHNFELTDGSYPTGGLIAATDGNFYGTTSQGGTGINVPPCFVGCGTIFKIKPGGQFETLYFFCSAPNCSDGFAPDAGLIQATDGNFYGNTTRGGNQCNGGPTCGTIFSITSTGTLRTLHRFDGNDGSTPDRELLQATNGTLYGAAPDGTGSAEFGTLFSIDIGLAPFVTFVNEAAKVGQTFGIIGQGFLGTSNVSLAGTPVNFTVKSGTLIIAKVPGGATTGYVTVTTPTGVLTSNVPFHVIP